MKVKIIEVGPRDGLQNEERSISLADKIKFIELLTEAGFEEIEVGAFVSPKWVPQMADSEEIYEHLKKHPVGMGLKLSPTQDIPIYSVLVPNMKGMEAALRVGAKKIAVFTAASETFNQKNINCSIKESIQRIVPVVQEAKKHDILVRGYISTAFICPYEGQIMPIAVLSLVQQLVDLGIQDISIGDTIGKATPEMTQELLDLLLSKFSKDIFAMHFHDTYQMALQNVETSLSYGITKYDSSAAGIGGCPFAPGAKGNVSTNELVAFFKSKNIQTGIDQTKLQEATDFILNVLGKI